MFNLTELKPEVTISPPRLLVYGQPGIGKSTFAASVPNVLMLNLEDGLDGIVCAQQKIASFDEFMMALTAFNTQDHPFKALAVDSLSALENMIHAQVAKNENVPSIADIGYGKGYKSANTLWIMVTEELDAIRVNKKAAIILLGHAFVKQFDDPLSESYSRFSLKLHEGKGEGALSTVTEWCDAVLFADQKALVDSTDKGFGKKQGRARAGKRMFYTGNHPAHLAKNRYALPDEIPMTWESLIHGITQSRLVNNKEN